MKGFAIFIWVGLAGVASIALFHITFEVERLQDELNGLNKEILEEQKAVHVLQAEWGYLTRPKHIEALSQRLLPHLQAPTANQVGDIEQFQATVSPASTRGQQ